MNENVVNFIDGKTIAEEAVVWLIRLDGETAPTQEELLALSEWLGRSPAHRAELNRLADFWGKLNVLTELAVPLGRFEARSNRDRVSQSRSTFQRLSIAALVIAIIGSASLLLSYQRPAPNAGVNDLYATAVGQQKSKTLADGSLILLNTNSQIKVEYGDDYRDIRLLQGEAHFTVVADADRPFRVFAGHGRVQALGTAFNVNLRGNSVDVTVTEGVVALASVGNTGVAPIRNQQPPVLANDSTGSSAIADAGWLESLGTLKAGESATVHTLPGDAGRAFEALEIVSTSEISKRLSWREGILTFTGDPLVSVVEEISRYTTVSIEISDPAVRDIRIGGRFPIGETDALFDVLEANFGLRVIRVGHDRIVLSAVERQ